MEHPLSYLSWPADEHARWIRAGHTFGRHLMAAARDYAISRMSKTMTLEERRVAEKAALDAIYGMMMLLDGVANSDLDKDHVVQYVLSAQVIDNGSKVPVEEFELAPNGDGLCMGFHAWTAGEFD